MATYKNSFFQLIVKDDGTFLKLFPPMDGGRSLEIKEVSQYLESENIYDYDITAVNSAIEGLESEPVMVKVSKNQELPV